ncbi:hypothetical protein RHSIM_Rhsim03G0014000 [Rhododendron simsii]|uniref:Disease resistance protein winged helix domain-containing protein n=1 Tax=Rhododendron simsii TaxID=118357 RepID=A0A834H9L3_RHOSS|nr:hypothetical protein RHSIM_Rhsim03G0014000 [Rhododendron simsii]
MSANPRLSSTLGISSAELKPTVSSGSANAHFSLSTSGSPVNTAAASTASPPESNYISYHHDLQLLINEIQEDMRKVDVDLNDYATRFTNHTEEASQNIIKFEEASKTLKKEIEEASKTLNSLADALFPSEDGPAEGPTETDVQQDLIELKANVVKLRLQILSEPNPKPPYTSKSNPNGNHRTNDSTHRKQKINFRDEITNLFKNAALAGSSEFKDFKELYDGLGDIQKLCLLCFSVFPEKAIIKKRFMFYWWTGEGFVAPAKGSDQTSEALANEVFCELMAKGFIEPFSEKRTLAGLVNNCQLNSFVRAAVITLARRAEFFDFDVEGKPTKNFYSSYRSHVSRPVDQK